MKQACAPLGQTGALPGRVPDQRSDFLMLAETTLRQALALDPTLTSARLRLGDVLALLGHAGAAAELEAVAATSRDAGERVLANLFLARLNEQADRPTAAVERARAAAREAPGSQAARTALVHALLLSGEREAAAREAAEAVTSELLPVDYYFVYRLGMPWYFDSSLEQLRVGIW